MQYKYTFINYIKLHLIYFYIKSNKIKNLK